MSVTPRRSWLKRTESGLWTGPAGHLIGGTLDLAEALARHLLLRARARARARSSR